MANVELIYAALGGYDDEIFGLLGMKPPACFHPDAKAEPSPQRDAILALARENARLNRELEVFSSQNRALSAVLKCRETMLGAALASIEELECALDDSDTGEECGVCLACAGGCGHA